ncbi:MAG: metallophosphoesterase family protein [Oscillospiraceae bacterium]|nr:metallophosphoesterase family protein [Oscillospiraceae bacterium]
MQSLLYRDDGTFVILVFADTHQTADDQPDMIAFLNESLDKVKPDLVVLNGDIVYGSACANDDTQLAAMTKVLTPIVSRGLRFAITLGNHDPEYAPGREALMKLYQSFPGCLAIEGEDLYGCGNYNLPICSSKDAKKIVSNLWFLDSGSYNEGELGGYDWVHEDQIAWYQSTSESLQAANGGKKVPSLLFQHIIVPEVYEGFFKAPFAVPSMTGTFNGQTRLLIPDFRKYDGFLLESPCPPYTSAGEFDAIAARGDVMAIITGHDHVNNFTMRLRGVDLVQIPGTTLGGSYGFEQFRGATKFILHEDAPESYEKELITYKDLAKEPDSGIARVSDGNEVGFWIAYSIEVIIQGVVGIFRSL